MCIADFKRIAIGALIGVLASFQVLRSQVSDYLGLYINEISPTNFQFKDEYGDLDDWIELYNSGPSILNLEGLYLTDDMEVPLKWQIGASYDITPGSFVIIWLDGEPEQGGLHASFKLSSGGEEIGLSQVRNDTVISIDSKTFGKIPDNVTLGRKPDGNNPFSLLGDITHGTSNNAARLYIAPPLIQPQGEIFTNAFHAKVSHTDTNAVIYYTLDGTEPDITSLLYTVEIPITSNEQITAKAFRTGYIGVSTKATYIKKIESNLPVLSLEMDHDDLFDNEKGIYVRGTNGITGYCVNYKANWNQDWEKPCAISLFEPDDYLAFKVNAGIKIGGGCSRGYNMKSFNVFLRGRYGDDFIPYEIYAGSGINEYYRIKIRNAGSDFSSMMLRDGLNQILLRSKVDIDLMNYRPSALYINGEFWGMYGIREFFNLDYVHSHHGNIPSGVDMIKNPFSDSYEIKEGDDTSFKNLLSFIQTNDLSIAENYQYVSGQIEMDEYINYSIAEIYFANYDWPSINTEIWRSRNGGKWRWMLYDTDGSTNFDQFYDTYPSYNSLEHATINSFDGWPNSERSTVLLRKLLENNNFRNEFAQRTCSFIELIFNSERVSQLTDSIVKLVNPVMDEQLAKWGENDPEQGWGLTMGGSIGAWQNNIQSYKDFFIERPNYMRQHLIEYLNLAGTYRLAINCDDHSMGSVVVNRIQLPLPDNYEGIYFKNIPVTLTAVPDEGYYFYKWDETEEKSPQIHYVGTENSSLTPIFTTRLPVEVNEYQPFSIFPNPSRGIIFIQFNDDWYYLNRIEVHNTLGQKVHELIFDEEQGSGKIKIDLSHLQNGVYYIGIISNKGENVEKLIIAD